MAAPAQKRATLAEEAQETSGATSASLLAYLDHVGGPQAVGDVLRRCRLQACEEELRDETTWFSRETKLELFTATAAVLDKPDFLPEMLVFAFASGIPASLEAARRDAGSLPPLLRDIAAVAGGLDRTYSLEPVSLRRRRASLRFAVREGVRHHLLECDHIAALLTAIPTLFGLSPGSVGHARCAAAGGDACIFELRWRSRQPRLRRGRWRHLERPGADGAVVARRRLRAGQAARGLEARDPVTGLLDAASFDRELEAELKRCAREKFYSALVLIELGSLAAPGREDDRTTRDQLLRSAAAALSDACRQADLAFQVGEHRFALLLSRVAEDAALKVADRVRATIAAADPRLEPSAGLAMAGPEPGDRWLLVAAAERQLSQAAPTPSASE